MVSIPIKYIGLAIGTLFFIMLSCTPNTGDSPPPLCLSKKTMVQLEKSPFIPAGDSLVTTEQMRSWLACNKGLDSLSLTYIDSFKTEEPAKRLAIQSSFALNQDEICIRNGLRSGYEEYVWVLKNSSLPKNRIRLDSLTEGTLQ